MPYRWHKAHPVEPVVGRLDLGCITGQKLPISNYLTPHFVPFHEKTSQYQGFFNWRRVRCATTRSKLTAIFVSGVEVSRFHRLLFAAWLSECGLRSSFSIDICHMDQTCEGTCKFVAQMLHIYIKNRGLLTHPFNARKITPKCQRIFDTIIRARFNRTLRQGCGKIFVSDRKSVKIFFQIYFFQFFSNFKF